MGLEIAVGLVTQLHIGTGGGGGALHRSKMLAPL